MQNNKKARTKASLQDGAPGARPGANDITPPTKRRLAAIIGTVLVPMMLALAACGGPADRSDAAKTTGSPKATAAASENPASVKAQELFTANKCISCHGVDLAGKVGPRSNLQKVGSTMSKEQIANQIKNGGGGMRPYKDKLSEEEIALLSDWLSTKK